MSRLAAVLGAVLGLAGAVAPALGQERPTGPDSYLRSLELPLRGDRIHMPRAVTTDPHTGEVFVCDTFENRILIFDQEGLFRHEIVGGGVFRSPIDLAVDAEGYLFVLAIHQGRQDPLVLDFDGRLIRPLPLVGLDPGVPAPSFVSVALSPAGNRLYLLDQANLRLWVADRDGRVLGSADLAREESEEDEREMILGHVDVYGETVLVAIPTLGQVLLFDLDARLQRTVGFKGTASCQMARPRAAALDPEGRLWVVDKQRALYMLWLPEENRCLREFSGFGNMPGALYQPEDLALQRGGELWISQGFEGRVQMFRPLGRAVERDGSGGDRRRR